MFRTIDVRNRTFIAENGTTIHVQLSGTQELTETGIALDPFGRMKNSVHEDYLMDESQLPRRETSIYRQMSSEQKQLIRFVVHDKFTSLLCVMVLVINLILILQPILHGTLHADAFADLGLIIRLCLLPGYCVLTLLTIGRITSIAARYPGINPRNRYDHVIEPGGRPRRIVLLLQSMLFVSLLCSSFLMGQQQKELLRTGDGAPREIQSSANERPSRSATFSLPILRHLAL